MTNTPADSPDDHAMTTADFAQIEFAPVPFSAADLSDDLFNEWFKRLKVGARIAAAMCAKTKDELVEMVRSMDGESIETALNLFTATEDITQRIGRLQEIAKAAEIRLFSAAAVACGAAEIEAAKGAS